MGALRRVAFLELPHNVVGWAVRSWYYPEEWRFPGRGGEFQLLISTNFEVLTNWLIANLFNGFSYICKLCGLNLFLCPPLTRSDANKTMIVPCPKLDMNRKQSLKHSNCSKNLRILSLNVEAFYWFVWLRQKTKTSRSKIVERWRTCNEKGWHRMVVNGYS